MCEGTYVGGGFYTNSPVEFETENSFTPDPAYLTENPQERTFFYEVLEMWPFGGTNIEAANRFSGCGFNRFLYRAAEGSDTVEALVDIQPDQLGENILT